MTVAKRKIVNVRREIGAKVAAEVRHLEKSTHDHAIWAARCLTVLLEAHKDAALPPQAGMEVVQMIGEMQMAAAENCVRAGTIHARLRALAGAHHIPLAGLPDCPENEVFFGN